MEGPICVLWKAKRTQAWYGLSEEEANDLLAKDSQSIVDLGGRNVITCDSRWGSERWEYLGIDEFPDLDAHLAHINAMDEIHLFRYWDCEFTVATKVRADGED